MNLWVLYNYYRFFAYILSHELKELAHGIIAARFNDVNVRFAADGILKKVYPEELKSCVCKLKLVHRKREAGSKTPSALMFSRPRFSGPLDKPY